MLHLSRVKLLPYIFSVIFLTMACSQGHQGTYQEAETGFVELETILPADSTAWVRLSASFNNPYFQPAGDDPYRYLFIELEGKEVPGISHPVHDQQLFIHVPSKTRIVDLYGGKYQQEGNRLTVTIPAIGPRVKKGVLLKFQPDVQAKEDQDFRVEFNYSADGFNPEHLLVNTTLQPTYETDELRSETINSVEQNVTLFEAGQRLSVAVANKDKVLDDLVDIESFIRARIERFGSNTSLDSLNTLSGACINKASGKRVKNPATWKQINQELKMIIAGNNQTDC